MEVLIDGVDGELNWMELSSSFEGRREERVLHPNVGLWVVAAHVVL